MRPKKIKSKNPRSTNPKSKGFKHIKALAELTAVLQEQRNLDTLIGCLQTALEIEFATVPPYLCAWWSIEDKTSDAAKSIREHIAEEEMLHIGLVCNLLASLDIDPDLTSPEAYPEYPLNLPEGIPTREQVKLRGFSKDALAVFLDIEYPMGGPITDLDTNDPPTIPGQEGGSNTIGTFYAEIKETFNTLFDAGQLPPLKTERQLELEFQGPEANVFVIEQVKNEAKRNSVEEAIDLIMKQGEGASGTPMDTGINDLAHYYRFLEIYKEKKIEQIPGSDPPEFQYGSEDIPLPQARAMAEVPDVGYDPTDEAIKQAMDRFDTQYTEMLLQIEAAWNPPVEGENGQDYLNAAIETMFALTKDAQWLMEQPIPNDPNGENYGPRFRIDDYATLPNLSALDDVVENPNWEEHIQYFFTEQDVEGMKGYIDFRSYESVVAHADHNVDQFGGTHGIIDRVQGDGSRMPPSHTGRRWSEGRIKTFQNWIDNDKPKRPVS